MIPAPVFPADIALIIGIFIGWIMALTSFDLGAMYKRGRKKTTDVE